MSDHSKQGSDNNPYGTPPESENPYAQQDANGYYQCPPPGYPPHYGAHCPPPPPGYPPHPGYGYHGHPGHFHPGHYHPDMAPPQGWHPHPHGFWPGYPPGYPQPQHEQAPQAETSDPFFEQAQAMLEGALGEEAGIFKELIGNMGMSDKEFWKGAMVGAAAALVLSNENVRNKLLGMVSGAGDMLKSGGATVKNTATQTASSVKENVTTGSEIFRDTYAAGKQGFKDSVERHKEVPETEEAAPEQIESAEPEAAKTVQPE